MLWRKGILAVAAALAVSACGTATGEAPVPATVSAADLAKVTLKVGDQKGGVKSLLTAANLLQGTPYKVEWATFTSGPPLLEAASAGAIDTGRVGNTPPIFAAAAKAKIKVISVSRSNVEREAVLVPPDAPLVASGPYRFVRHPNYVAIAGEMIGTALIVWAPIAGAAALVGFGSLIWKRVRVEDRALGRQ